LFGVDRIRRALSFAIDLGLDDIAEKLLAANEDLVQHSGLVDFLRESAVMRADFDVYKVLHDYCAGQPEWISESARLAVRQERADILKYLLQKNNADPLCQADYQEAMAILPLVDHSSESTTKILHAAGANMDARTGHPVHKILAAVLLNDAERLGVHLREVIDPRQHDFAFRCAVGTANTNILSLLLEHGIGLEFDESLFQVCRWAFIQEMDRFEELILLLLRYGASDYHAALDRLSRLRSVQGLDRLLNICITDYDKVVASMLKHRYVSQSAHRCTWEMMLITVSCQRFRTSRKPSK
jgi:hypothetical protein